MGIMTVFGYCVNCGTMFGFSPTYVPSISVNGAKEPVCRDCFEEWKIRQNKLDWPLHPMAYIGDDESEP